MSIAYIFMLIAASFVALFVVAESVRTRGLRSIVLVPAVLLSLYFSIIHFITPLVKYVYGKFRYTSDYKPETYLIVAFCTILTYAFCLLLSFAAQRRSRPIQSFSANHAQAGDCILIGAVLFSIGGIIAWQDLATISTQIGLQAFRLDVHSFSSERGALRILASLMIIGTAIYQAGLHNFERQSIVVKVTALGIFVGMMIFSVQYFDAMSSRNSILLLTIFNIGVFAAYSSARLLGGRRKIGPLILVILAGATMGWLAYNVTIDRYSVVRNEYFSQRLANVPLYMLDGAFGNDEALLWMVENGHQTQYGLTYIAGFVNIIPRTVWEDKPLGGGPRLINEIRPGAYVQGRSGNNSLTTGMLAEAMMNFGYFGFPIIASIWAYLTATILGWACVAKSRVTQVVCLLVAMSLSSQFLYAEFLGFFARMSIMFTFPLALASGIMILKRIGGGSRVQARL